MGCKLGELESSGVVGCRWAKWKYSPTNDLGVSYAVWNLSVLGGVERAAGGGGGDDRSSLAGRWGDVQPAFRAATRELISVWRSVFDMLLSVRGEGGVNGVRGEGGGCRLDERRNGVRLGGGGR